MVFGIIYCYFPPLSHNRQIYVTRLKIVQTSPESAASLASPVSIVWGIRIVCIIVSCTIVLLRLILPPLGGVVRHDSSVMSVIVCWGVNILDLTGLVVSVVTVIIVPVITRVVPAAVSTASAAKAATIIEVTTAAIASTVVLPVIVVSTSTPLELAAATTTRAVSSGWAVPTPRVEASALLHDNGPSMVRESPPDMLWNILNIGNGDAVNDFRVPTNGINATPGTINSSSIGEDLYNSGRDVSACALEIVTKVRHEESPFHGHL